MRTKKRDYDLFDLLRSRFKCVLGFLIEYGGFASDGELVLFKTQPSGAGLGGYGLEGTAG